MDSAMRADSVAASGASKDRRRRKNTSCRPMTPSPTGRQRRFELRALGDRIEVQIDDAIQAAYRDLHRVRQLLEVEALGREVAREVDGAEVADGGLGRTGDLDDLGTQIRQMDHLARLGGLIAAAVAGVLEGHPALPVCASVRIMRHTTRAPAACGAPEPCVSACT